MNSPLTILLSVVLGLLTFSSLLVSLPVMKRRIHEKTYSNLIARVKAWWIMVGVFGLSLLAGKNGVVILYALLSFLALREFITINKTNKEDHRILCWAFFIILPLHYLLIFLGWYTFFIVFIPVYAFIFIPIRQALAGNTENFLSRTARIQWGLLITVYFLSHVPWILQLQFTDCANTSNGASLLFWLVMVSQLNDVLQYVFGKRFGKKPLSPSVSPNKTVEGFLGGVLTSAMVGSALSFATPFGWAGAFLMALLVCLLGTAGGLVMSCIKRDLGSKDWGAMISGHGGVLDRVDGLLFAAPIFFHISAFFFSGEVLNQEQNWLSDLLKTFCVSL